MPVVWTRLPQEYNVARARLGHAHGATQALASARENPEMERAAIRP